ncbi:MAG: glycosyl transferase [Candidatus Aminicenantes bacterium RBG_19FT_COMBO_58_17]|jgi:glycosyltransferase involved in cell wall biosynthesis|nr:MAG: glycosyl transferase [Candidatus Aminicenantes bacterium RBG_19FT_COMBO_58_17]
MKTTQRPYVSLVIPVFNEAENLAELYRELVDALEKSSRAFEVIFIDDGSADSSWTVLRSLQQKDGRIKLIRLRRNFGQTAALAAGFDYARSEIIISLDADLQNDPKDIPLLIRKIEEGYDIVNGWRRKRKDKFLSRRVPSIIANQLISRLTRVRLHDYGCTLKAFRSEVIKNVKLYGELHRFIPAIASQLGVRIAEVEVSHRPRKHGKSKYSLFRITKVILDMLTVKFLLSYSTRPLQIFGLLGLGSGLLGFIISLWLSYQRLALKISVANRPLLLLGVLLIVIGIQFITLGLLAEIMVRAYHESSGKTIYVIREVIDSETEGGASITP